MICKRASGSDGLQFASLHTHLHLDVPRPLQVLLDQNVGIAKGL
jgi:hypothetical protein